MFEKLLAAAKGRLERGGSGRIFSDDSSFSSFSVAPDSSAVPSDL